MGGTMVNRVLLWAVLTVDAEEWQAELALIEDWVAMLGPRLPAALRTELERLADHLGSELPEPVHGR
jgi:phosphoenolpyruvate carboxykinase (GTP)